MPPADPATRPGPPAPGRRLADDPAVLAALAARNDRLARFWLEQRGCDATGQPALAGRRVLIVDGEDTFTGMLTHQLRALGLTVTVRSWNSPGPTEGFDLVVAGPGPGDPGSPDDPKMVALRRVVGDRLAGGRPLFAVCLSHQILATLLGLRLRRRAAPYQGLRREVDLFGQRRTVGFYSTFTPVSDHDTMTSGYGPVHLARDPADGAVHALRGPTFASVQFHPESVLSYDGMAVLAEFLGHLLPVATTLR